jgi:DNA polymerase-1
MAVQGDLFAAPEAPVVPAPVTPEVPAPPPVPEPVAAPAPRSVMLIDTSGFVFRAYHALPPLTTSKGVPTHAVLGFTRMLLKLMRERAPTHLALCFDKDSRLGRLAIDPNYKANREAPPADLSLQFGLIRQVAHVLQVPTLEVAGWEADDVIATVVQQNRAHGYRTEIISSDKDFLQLLADDVGIYDPVKDLPITEATAHEKYGVKPSQMRDYQALVGDAVDNIPKVPGIGPKTAAELLGRFGDVHTLLARLPEVTKPKTKQALADHREQLLKALQLVSFRSDLPLVVNPDDLARKPILTTEAKALFNELEFFRLIHEMPASAPTPLKQATTLVADEAALRALAQALLVQPRLAVVPVFDGEPHSATLLGLALGQDDGASWYVPVAQVGVALVAEVLGPVLGRAGVALLTHDGKALLHVLARAGFPPLTLHGDVELLSYLMNPSRREHELAQLAREHLRVELPVWPTLEGVRGRVDAAALPAEALMAWAGAGAEAVGRLAPELVHEAQVLGLSKLYDELELPLVPVLTKLEQRGICLDLAALQEISSQVDAQCEAMLAQVYRHAGHEFNVGSPAQLAHVLYEELKLPVLRKNKTGPSTDHEVLEKLAEEHPLPQAIIDYRTVDKLKSTYLDTLPLLIGADGRVRTTVHQAAAATGRLSSTNPNLQNIPVRTELGRQIRRAFVAREGWALVSADYSQVELRILAHVSQDEGLIAAFAEGADVHARTAAEVFGVPLAEVTGDQRRVAKMVNYGIAYGLSAHGLSTRLNLPVAEAQGIITRYFERFPGIAGYISGTVEKARRQGYVESLFGRRRYMPDLVSRNRAVAMGAERAAINMPIQGTAADLVKRAMLVLDRRLEAEGFEGRMLLQVHDELLFEAPLGEVERLSAVAREVMAQAGALVVPLVVDVGHGHSWAQAH